jgi:hypothetical protein
MRKHNSKLELNIKPESYLEWEIIIITRNIIIKEKTWNEPRVLFKPRKSIKIKFNKIWKWITYG